MNATLRRLPITAVSQNPLATYRAVQTPKTDFLRSFFGGRSASPNTIMAAKTKAQDIIDNNSVGK